MHIIFKRVSKEFTHAIRLERKPCSCNKIGMENDVLRKPNDVEGGMCASEKMIQLIRTECDM